MPQKSSKSSSFWQELKRRKVFSVVTTYAATAYIIIEVTNNLAVPLHLPDWVATLILIILLIGLPVVVILSWIFDFTPQGIKKTESLEELENKEIAARPVKGKLRASYVLNAVLIIAVIILVYPKIFRRDTLENLRAGGRISVAVLPFQNVPRDTTLEYLGDYIQTSVISVLSENPEELKVSRTQTIASLLISQGLSNNASITPSVAGNLSHKLDANTFIWGSIKKTGQTLLINAELTGSKTGEVLKSFLINVPAKEEMIVNIIDSLSGMIKDFLMMSKLKNENPDLRWANTKSPQAFRYFLAGIKAGLKLDWQTAIEKNLAAISLDSNFIDAGMNLSLIYGEDFQYENARKWCNWLFGKMDLMTEQQKIWTNIVHARYFETPFEEIKYLRQSLNIDDQSTDVYWVLGLSYWNLGQFDKALPEFEKYLKILRKWGSKPGWELDYTNLAYCYQKTGQYYKEHKLLKKAEKDFPDGYMVKTMQASLALIEKDTVAANRYIKKFKTICKSVPMSEAVIATRVAGIYIEGGMNDKAEEYYRRALSFEPENPDRLNYLAYFLIDRDRNITEGMNLVVKVLELNPDNYQYLRTKGWGLYKQGKYKEALSILQRSWDLRIKKTIYSYKAFLELEAAKKAVADQKN